MSPAQCRAARALLGLPRRVVAKAAVVPANLIADYEAGLWVPRVEDLAAVQRALEAAGVCPRMARKWVEHFRAED
jgi:hypothetical protein